jgi:hypothetical protein
MAQICNSIVKTCQTTSKVYDEIFQKYQDMTESIDELSRLPQAGTKSSKDLCATITQCYEILSSASKSGSQSSAELDDDY